MEKLVKYTNTEHILKTNELVDKVNQLEESGGKIQVVKVDGTPLEIDQKDKSVNIDLSPYAEDEDIFLYVGDSNSIPQDKMRENMIIIDPEERVVGEVIEVDAALSSTSINPIQNKAVKAEVDKINANIEKNKTAIEELKVNGGKIQSVKVNNKVLEVAPDKSVNIDLTGYAEDKDIYLYVGKDPVVSKLNENTIVIDPDEASSAANIIIDTELSTESENSVQNKVITKKINQITSDITDINKKVPTPTPQDTNKFLKGDGSWAEIQKGDNGLGYHYFEVRDGNLYCIYDDTGMEPNFKIREDGHLVYSFEVNE